MAESSEFYLARAAESARNAKSATLRNVRDRCWQSEAAWRSIAERAALGEAKRAKLAAEKAAREEKLAEQAP